MYYRPDKLSKYTGVGSTDLNAGEGRYMHNMKEGNKTLVWMYSRKFQYIQHCDF